MLLIDLLLILRGHDVDINWAGCAHLALVTYDSSKVGQGNPVKAKQYDDYSI
jgi:hypothetical protein